MNAIRIEYNQPPVPFMRPRFFKGRGFNDPKYDRFKKDLATYIRTQYPNWVVEAPPTLIPNVRRKWVKVEKQKRYSLSIQVYAAYRKGDLSNFVKALEDALQDAGVIFDDEQIDAYHEPFFKTVDPENPRVVFELKLLDNER